MKEKKVEELLVAEPDLAGLRRLQGLGLLTASTTAPAGDGRLASSWTTTTAATTTSTDGSTTEGAGVLSDDRVHLDAQGRVTYLNLGGRRLHRGLDASLFQNHFSALSTLNLGGTDLPAQNTVDILNTTAAGTVESLHLGGNGLGDEGAELLAASNLSSLPQLRKLDLRYNDISGVGMAALCRAWREGGGGGCPNLTHLHMEGNRIGDDGCQALAEWMLWQPAAARRKDDDDEGDDCDSSSSSSACRLEQVFLGANRIGPAGAAHLARALQQGNDSRLTKLYLEGNRIGEEGAAALSRALENANNNVRGGTRGAAAALKNLYVDNNNIGREGSQRLAKALNSATAIPDGF